MAGWKPAPRASRMTHQSPPSGAMKTLCLLLAALLSASFVLAQAPAEKKAEPANKLYEFRKDHDPDGTGKFYRGREIAQVMSHLGAGWLERPEREKEEH